MPQKQIATRDSGSLDALVSGLIAELDEMKNAAYLRGNDLTRSDELRASHNATASAYAYCQLRLRMIQESANKD